MKKLLRHDGFTLIEVLVGLGVLAGLTGVLFATVNPIEQIRKSADSERLQDLNEIKNALDAYYHDKNCYPEDSIGIPFGQEWSEGETVYMKTVPQDPKCAQDTSYCYSYIVDTSTCPQWFVVFAKLQKASSVVTTCPLAASSCVPAGYSSAEYACQYGGNVNCAFLAEAPTLTPTQAPTSTPTPAPTSSPTPPPSQTPTPTPTLMPGGETYTIGMNQQPNIYSTTLNPFTPGVGQTQTIYVSVSDTTSSVNGVNALVITDNSSANLTLSLLQGNGNDGVWGVSWVVNDTINSNYGLTIVATDTQVNSSTAELSFK